MSERPESVLFGVEPPDTGGLSAGQLWTAALAVGLAALLIAFGGGGTTLVAQAPAGASGAPSVQAGPVPTTTSVPSALESAPAAPPPLAPFDGAAPLPSFPSEPTEPPAPPPSGGGGTNPPPDGGGGGGGGGGGDEPPAECATPVAPVLAGAGLCPPS